MEFRKSLKKAQEENLNIGVLSIAYELEGWLQGEEVSDEQFDKACKIIYDIHMDNGYFTIACITEALMEMVNYHLNNYDLSSISYSELEDKASYLL